MRILHVIGSMNPSSGGPCQGIRNSSHELDELGVKREVVCFDDSSSFYVESDTFLITTLGKCKSTLQYNSKLKPWLRENLSRFDVVVTNGLWLYHSQALCQIIVELKKEVKKGNTQIRIPRWYVMPHGMLDPYFQRAPSRMLKAIRNWFYWKFVEHKVVEQADGLLFTCQTELELARSTFKPYLPKKEINVGYGVENPPVLTDEMNIAFQSKCSSIKNSPYILFLSRIHEKKGVDLLINAYIKLSLERRISGQILPKLVIAGPGIESAYGKSIVNLLQKYPDIQSKVLFPGMLTDNSKWGAFYGCDAFILPSHQENFGIAVVEALACGIPVLISNKVNIWKEIEDGKGGIVENDSRDGTYRLLEKWLNLSNIGKQSMKVQARYTFERYFSIKPAAIKFKDAVS